MIGCYFVYGLEYVRWFSHPVFFFCTPHSFIPQNHHAVVVDKEGEFKGLISSWDITAECARDDRAWPWNRQEGGKFHRAGAAPVANAELATSPTTPVDEAHITQNVQDKTHLGDSFRNYIDNLGLVDM
jgi:hypothetical protein